MALVTHFSMNRKEFIKRSCGICVALGSGYLLSSAVAACKTPLGVVKTSAKNKEILIALTEFEKSDFKLVRVSNYDYDLAVQKLADGSYETLVLKCTHAGQPLTKTGSTYYCTLHGSQFGHDGKVLKGPAEQNMTKLKSTILIEHLCIHI